MQDMSNYILWLNDAQFNRKFLSIKPCPGWSPEYVYDGNTDTIRPLADLTDEEWNALPHVFAKSHDCAWYKERGWDRGASILVPNDDPRYAADGSFQPDSQPRWEVKPEHQDNFITPVSEQPMSKLERVVRKEKVEYEAFGGMEAPVDWSGIISRIFDALD